MRRFFTLLALAAAATAALADDFTLTILHTDDLHGHLEPVTIKSGKYGGYARQVTLVKKYLATDPNPVVLSGGDTFQGTLFFNVYQGMADLYFMNLMRYDGMATGNHEFDLGPGPLRDFVQNASFPVLCANLDFSQEPLLSGLIKPHTVITVGGQRIGLIGAVTPDLMEISSPGPNVKMLDLIPSIEKSVAALSKEGVNKIILLSHLGYVIEKEVALKVQGLDVIVGGHSHTLLGEFDNPDFPPSEGPYPTVINKPGSERTLIVAAWEWGKVLGRIKVNFDELGRVASWTEANPIVVGDSVAEDPLAKTAIAAFSKPIQALRTSVIAQAPNGIDGSRETVRNQESPMGNVLADAMLEATQNADTSLALLNGGGVRGGVDAGPVTYEEAIQVQPFNNTLVVLELTGSEIKEALEFGVEGIAEAKGAFLHVSKGSSYAFDLSKPKGQKVSNVVVAGQPLDLSKSYKVVMNSFMGAGGDAFEVFKNAKGARVNTGVLDIDVLVDYLKKHSPVEGKVEGRIKKLG